STDAITPRVRCSPERSVRRRPHENSWLSYGARECRLKTSRSHSSIVMRKAVDPIPPLLFLQKRHLGSSGAGIVTRVASCSVLASAQNGVSGYFRGQTQTAGSRFLEYRTVWNPLS